MDLLVLGASLFGHSVVNRHCKSMVFPYFHNNHPIYHHVYLALLRARYRIHMMVFDYRDILDTLCGPTLCICVIHDLSLQNKK